MSDLEVRFFEQDLVSQDTGLVVRTGVLFVEKTGGIDLKSTHVAKATEEDVSQYNKEYQAFLAAKEAPKGEEV